MYIDTHTHLNFKVFEDSWPDVVLKAQALGVNQMVVVGTNLETSAAAMALSEKHPALYAAVGIHPHHAKYFLHEPKKSFQQNLFLLETYLSHPRVVALGEIGIDYHAYKHSSRYPTEYSASDWQKIIAIQKQLFQAQVKLAGQAKKPLILHSREAGQEVLTEIISALPEKSSFKGVFHCFEGSKKYLDQILSYGFYVGFTGELTYRPDRTPIALATPLDRLLLETDSPYMSPLPFKGLVNNPGNVTITAGFHAQIRSIKVDKIASQTSQNATKLFGLT